MILLTNDGDVVNEILRSENNHEKEYIVTVDRPITDLALRMMASGVKIMGQMTKPCTVTRIDGRTFRMILTQGLNRQIRRMCSALGYRTQRLQRVRIINIHLGTLGVGQWRNLTESEVADLMRPRAARDRRDAAGVTQSGRAQRGSPRAARPAPPGKSLPEPSSSAAPPRERLPTIGGRSWCATRGLEPWPRASGKNPPLDWSSRRG